MKASRNGASNEAAGQTNDEQHDTPLFRPRAVERWQGKVHSSPLHAYWRLTRWASSLSAALLAALVASIFLVEYATVYRMPGRIEMPHESLKLMALDDGQLRDLACSPGQEIHQGDVVASIDRSRWTGEGLETSRAVRLQFMAQRKATIDRINALVQARKAQMQGIAAKVAQLRSEMELSRSEASSQEDVVEQVQQRLLAEQNLQASGFLSPLALAQRKAEFHSAQARLAAAKAAALKTEREHDEAVNSRLQLAAEIRALQSELEGELSRLGIAQVQQGTERLHVRAPVSGVVAAAHARAGQTVIEGTPLCTIMPQTAGAEPVLKIFVPQRALASIRPGATLRYEVDAYPRSKYGSLATTVSSVSGTAVPANEVAPELGTSSSVYVAIANVTHPATPAMQLKSGMTITAQIELERRTIIEWILEPLITRRKPVI